MIDFLNNLCPFVEILTEFIHSSLKSDEHLYNHYFEFFGK